MTIQEFLNHCRQLGIRISPEGQNLRVQAPPGAMTPEIRQQLASRKAEILELLNGTERATQPAVKTQPPAVKTPALMRAPRDPQDTDSPLPLSFAQQRLWLIDQIEPGSPTYNLPLALDLLGQLDLSTLAATLSEIVRRHEVLRTTFPSVNGEPRQVVAPPGRAVLTVVDLSGLKGLPESERELERLLSEEARHPFDLATGPLLRFRLVRLGAEEHVATVNMHHIISDAWSFGILIREIATLYPALLAGRRSPLPELPIQYSDFSHWQRNRLQGEALEAEVAYWRERLQGAPPVLDLPADRPRRAPQSDRGALSVVSLSPEVSAEVAALARREGVTLFMALLAVFQTLLLRWTGQTDLSIGAPVAGRSRIETESLIGFFVNTLVLRTDLSGDPTFRELLGRVRDTMVQALRHQDLPFEKLVEELKPERSLGHTALFQVMFSFQNTPQEELELPGLRLRPHLMDSRTSKFDLLLELTETSTGIFGTLSYRTELFDATTVERLVSSFLRLVEGAVRQPDARLSDLPSLSPEELHQVLQEWNDTRWDISGEPWLDQLLDSAVAVESQA